jgi:phytoene synthase
MTPDEYCQNKAAQSGSSFYYSFMFLPPERRRAITAVYAYCREVDDVVDECTDTGIARTKLAWWRDELARLYAGSPQHPVARALQPHLTAFDLKHELMLDILDGMEMDLTQNRYLDFANLEKYCYRVASAVGLLAARIFGYTEVATLGYARDLGTAFQLTNIVRDVGEDARKDRVYLPLDELARFGITVQQLLDARYDDNFAKLMAFQAARAEDYYERAFAQLPAADRAAQRPGLIMAAIYRTLLAEIRNDGFRVLDRRTALTPIRKLWIACKTWVRA